MEGNEKNQASRLYYSVKGSGGEVTLCCDHCSTLNLDIHVNTHPTMQGAPFREGGFMHSGATGEQYRGRVVVGRLLARLSHGEPVLHHHPITHPPSPSLPSPGHKLKHTAWMVTTGHKQVS